MKKLKSRGLNNLKTVHLILVSMWLGGGIALVVMINALYFEKGEALFGYLYAMKIVDDFIIIPGAMGNLLIGILYGVLTGWGFFKHKWITVKWILTVSLILFGTFYLGPMVNGSVDIAEKLSESSVKDPEIASNLLKLNIWGSIQILFLIFMMYISVFKPWKKKRS